MSQARITRVRLENYKSIKFCDVQLEPITVLVGQNGSGKSNFLDAFAFLGDCLRGSVQIAIKLRDGKNFILYKDELGFQSKFLKMEFWMKESQNVTYYGFGIEFYDSGKHLVFFEKLAFNERVIFDITDDASMPHQDLTVGYSQLNLLLSSFTDIKESTQIVSYFEEYQVINPKADKIKKISKRDYGLRLMSDGSNISSIFSEINDLDPSKKVSIERYLHKINPDFDSISVEMTKSEHILLYFSSSKYPSRFFETSSISDGTLRAFAIITSIFFSYKTDILEDKFTPAIGLGFEEPETNLHPSALISILEAFRATSDQMQILVSSHSPDLLEGIDLESGNETVLAVESKDGETVIAPIDAASREIVRRNLYTLGDLLRMNQLEPERNPKLEGSF